jgi:hypothetical protein
VNGEFIAPFSSLISATERCGPFRAAQERSAQAKDFVRFARAAGLY